MLQQTLAQLICNTDFEISPANIKKATQIKSILPEKPTPNSQPKLHPLGSVTSGHSKVTDTLL